MGVPDTTLLSHGELHALLRQHGLTPAAGSPLQPVLATPPAGDEATLRRQGLMDGAWCEALTVLCAPDLEVRRLLALPAATVVANHYGSRDRGPGLSACHEEDGRVRIGLVREPHALAATEAEALDTATSPPPERGELTLGVEALNVLAAAVDALRTVLFASLLQRSEAPDLRFRRADLGGMLQHGLDHHDARWLVTLLRLLAPPACQPYPSDLQRGWDELTAAGLLQAEGDDRWRPAELLLRLAAYWKVPLPAAGYQLTLRRRDGSTVRRGRITLRGDGPLWVLDYEDPAGAQPQVRLRSVPGGDYAGELASLMTPAPEPEASPAAPTAPAPDTGERCAKCAAPLPAGARFCSHCGAAAAPPAAAEPAEPAFCPTCGAERRPGTRFCTQCGQPW